MRLERRDRNVVLVLLANPVDSTSVAAFARDMGFSSHRAMTHSRFRSMVGADHVLPLFVVFKRGRPAVIVNGMTSRGLDALDVIFLSHLSSSSAVRKHVKYGFGITETPRKVHNLAERYERC